MEGSMIGNPPICCPHCGVDLRVDGIDRHRWKDAEILACQACTRFLQVLPAEFFTDAL